MDKTILGRTGLEVTVGGLGCGGFSRIGMFSKGIDNAVSVIRYAYDHGVNFFDTAYVYGTQPAVGKALGELQRDSYIISTKFMYSKDNAIKEAALLEKDLDESLQDLRSDYIDIYHLHGVKAEDYNAVCDRFYPELIKMKEKGKIRFLGITEAFVTDTAHQTLKLAVADDLWDVIMVGYNLLNPSAAHTILPKTREKNIGTLCMFAIRRALADPQQLKYDVQKMINAGQVDERLVNKENTLDFLVERGYAETVMEAAYRFCRHTKGIDVTLTGTGNINHLKQNLKSIQKPPLPEEALEMLKKMFGGVDCVSGQKLWGEM